eukprot:CAMPEP_0115584540 /NCGR_PEP_ID=MMETSP0272-20121206/6737_1 /TAXON_ID=71861 /ORGANISM="Scrippsiella trochoidea, Strain CCMP3099" /LENGTH=47 /DNA_ID= /DNA_START= /DNA_END= /DNA_ORIENTATION=
MSTADAKKWCTSGCSRVELGATSARCISQSRNTEPSRSSHWPPPDDA